LFFGLPILALVVGYQAGTKNISKKFGIKVAEIAEKDSKEKSDMVDHNNDRLVSYCVGQYNKVISVCRLNSEDIVSRYVIKRNQPAAKASIDNAFIEFSEKQFVERLETDLDLKLLKTR